MTMQKYEELKEMLCEELEKIVEKGELSAGSLETVHKLTDTIKNVDKIEMMDDNGQSMNGHYSMAYDDDGMSYARRGQHYVRGHYSRDGYMKSDSMDDRESYARRGGRYSRDGGRDYMMEQLGEMMSGASEKERDILKKAMRQLENA